MWMCSWSRVYILTERNQKYNINSSGKIRNFLYYNQAYKYCDKWKVWL